MSVATKLLVLALLGGCARVSAGTVAESNAVPAPREDGRLPPGTRPTRYALDLAVDPAAKSFTGRARIGVNIDRPTRVIVLHARGMSVREATLTSGRVRFAATPRLRLAAGSKTQPEELTLAFAETVPAGEAEIQIDYEATFGEGLKGLYRVEQGKDLYAYTQFEPNDARRAFPCFDEPGYKTPFDVAITVPKGTIAVANAREASRRDVADGLHVRFEFERSLPLPTYLVAFAVGPFDLLEGPRKPVAIRMIATRGQAALGRDALNAAAAHLDLLGKYFDRPYPYSKLDIVAVPNFGAGAMENAGLVTFREELVLLDSRRASTMARRLMASVMAHELAHQWFGDLVTMKWWDDLWLNEAFASWMSDKIVDAWRPETRAQLQAISGKWQVMAEDTLSSARKIRNPVRNTGEALEAFDAITYGKGRAVLQMTESWLGEEVFRDGLRRYMKDHAFGNATAADLYASLTEASGGRPVAAMMDSFTDQTGVPLLTARSKCPNPGVQLQQRRYSTIDQIDRANPTGSSNDHAVQTASKLWRIPACVFSEVGTQSTTTCSLLEGLAGEIFPNRPGSAAGCPALVYGNAGEAGYYRVGVTGADLAGLAGRARDELPERERAGLINNAWAAVWSGELHVPELLAALGGFKTEKSRLVWDQIVDALITTDRALTSDEARPAFAKLVRDLLSPTGRRLGFVAKTPALARRESDEEKLLRELVLGTLGRVGDDGWTLSEAKRLADRWLSHPMAGDADADVARVALSLAARRGDGAMFDRLVAVLRDPKTPEMRVLALSGLSGFEDPSLVERTLALTLDGTIRSQDFRYVFAPLGLRRATRDVTQAWIQRHFDEVVKIAPSSQIARIVRLASALCDRERVRATEAFLRPRVAKIEGAEKDMRQAVEEGLRCATLAEKERDATSRWLTEDKSGAGEAPRSKEKAAPLPRKSPTAQ